MRRILLIGYGTLGAYAAEELLNQGWSIDVIALEEHFSFNRNVRFFKGRATDEMLKDLFCTNRYDAIIDYIHYNDVESFKRRAKLMLDNTDQYIFLSSYRVYAESKVPITEDSAQLLDTVNDRYYLDHESYAIPKSRNENTLRTSGRKNWTIVRPLISFSHYRLDMVTQGGYILITRSRAGKEILMPEISRLNTAGLGWAGNIGRMFGRLAGNEQALGEAFTLGTGEKKTWEDVAGYYAETIGARFKWVSTEDYFKYATMNSFNDRCALLTDRAYDREINADKVKRVTGLKSTDFLNIHQGIIRELNILSERPELVEKMGSDTYKEISRRMDEYLSKQSI